MKMVNAKGEAVYFNRVMKNGREQFVVKALDGQHLQFVGNIIFFCFHRPPVYWIPTT